MNSIVVFCGSGSGHDGCYVAAAQATGVLLAQAGITVVYGGARIGLMGAVADAALAAGGSVTGVIPGFLHTREVAHSGLTTLIMVDNMHERKMKMHELSDGIITLPGGWGTMEELFEMLTWGQLGLHKKPIGLLNVNGYYDALVSLCDGMVQSGFLQAEVRGMLLVSDDVATLLELMRAYVPPAVPKWMKDDET